MEKKTMQQEMNDSRKRVVTTWIQGSKRGNYTTKSVTAYHKFLHGIETMDNVQTVIHYLDVVWPFGIFSEIIAQTNKLKPHNNKQFPIELIVQKPVKV